MQCEGGAVAAEVLRRVGEVRREALLVLADLAGEGQPFAP